MQRKPKKKPFGGFSIDPSLGGLLSGIDLNNLDFSQVAQLGSQIGGDPFNQAMAFDDPSMYTDSIVGMASGQYAAANNPLRTPEEIEEEAKKRTFLGIGKGHARRKLRHENEARERDNMTTTGQNTNSALEQFQSMSGLFDLIGNFQNGGKLQNGGTTQDSVRYLAEKTMDYERLRGSAAGTGLPNYGNPALGSNPTKDSAVEWYMQNIYPKLGPFSSAMEKGEAGDFMYNSGKDVRPYAIQEYLKEHDPNNTRKWKDAEGKYKDRKDPTKWDAYWKEIQELPVNSRRILINKGRDWYYQNINNPSPGVPNDAYLNTWYGRIWNTNDLAPFDPSNPKFTPKKQLGGSLKKLQDGGEFVPNKLTDEEIFLIQYMNDPNYTRRLSKFHKDPVAERNSRITNMQQLRPLEDVLPEELDGIMIGENRGMYVHDPVHAVHVDENLGNEYVNLHELSHAATKAHKQLSRKERTFIFNNTRDSDKYSQEHNDYFREPTEYKARLDVLRYWMNKSGKKDFNDISVEDIRNMEEMPEEVYNQFEQILDVTKGRTPKEKFKNLKKAWNTLATSDTDNPEVWTAALGGKSQLGYSDNSPYKNEPSITIDSNIIDMSKTSTPLMAIPDIGHPKMLKPKSGTHVFPDATKVLEVPVMAKGGKRKKKIPYYQEGGQPVPQGVQLEEDEVILTPNMDILDTAARKPHQKMDSKTVTDIMRPEDYVLSNRLKIKKSEAEKMSLGFGAMLYREGQIPKMPEEQTIASIFKDNEKELTLAEYGKRVRKKLPITDKDDPFSLKTNDANRAARLPYLAAAVYKNEMKRTKGKPEYQFESAFENPFESSFSSNAGMTDEGMSVMGGIGSIPEQKPGGGPLDALGAVAGIGNFFTGILDTAFYAPKRAKMAQAAIEADRKAIGTLAETQSGFSNAATAAALAGYSLQDPTVNAPQYDSTQLDARAKRIPRTLFDYASGRAMAGARSFQDSLFKHAGSFGQAANAYAPVHGQNVGMLAGLGMQEVQQNIGLENQYRDMKQGFNDKQTLANTIAGNATKANQNSLIAGTASTISGGISSQGKIETNRQNALRENALQKSQSQINANSLVQQGTQQALNNLYMGAASLPSDMFNVQSITPTPPATNFNPYTISPPVQIQSPTYSPIQPLPPVNNPYLPTNQQGSAVPLGPNSVYNPSTGLWYG